MRRREIIEEPKPVTVILKNFSCFVITFWGKWYSSKVNIVLSYTAISIKVVPRPKRKSQIQVRKAAGNR
jgi:hypothetical protein